MPRPIYFLPALIIALSLPTTFAPAAEPTSTAQPKWSNWRGPQGTGLAVGATPPTTWGESKNLSWKIELPGPGHATPVVWGDSIFVLSAVSVPSEKKVKKTPPPPPPTGGPPRQEKPTDAHQFMVTALSRKDGSTLWQTVVQEECPATITPGADAG